ncbi:SDR family NAD(P)-dependent oxidoreductase [Mycolicibacterium sp. A43C]
MTTRTVIITGASAGLGLECARAILAADDSWHIVLAVRDAGRGQAAVADLGAPDRCTVLTCDLTRPGTCGRPACGWSRRAQIAPERALPQ